MTVLSESLPSDMPQASIANILYRKEVLVAFASGGEANSSPQEIPVTAEWESAWRKYCEKWYGEAYLPRQGDSIYKSRTYTRFPGLTLCTEVYTGVKILPRVGSKGLPGYCFLVIGQEQTAKGLPPVVWMFHQIMGTKPVDQKVAVEVDSLVPSGPIKSIYCVEASNVGQLHLKLQSNFQFRLEFPAVLLKIMPMSRAKAERQGSTALSKTITKAANRAIECGYKAFLRLHQESVSVNQS